MPKDHLLYSVSNLGPSTQSQEKLGGNVFILQDQITLVLFQSLYISKIFKEEIKKERDKTY